MHKCPNSRALQVPIKAAQIGQLWSKNARKWAAIGTCEIYQEGFSFFYGFFKVSN